MKDAFIGIRNVNQETFRKFKARAVEKNLNLGNAMEEAMEKWVDEGKKERKSRKPKVKPFDWGEDTQKTSMEIDTILYDKKSVS